MIEEDYPQVEDNILEIPRGIGSNYIHQIAQHDRGILL
jgi:hypothetical protein